MAWTCSPDLGIEMNLVPEPPPPPAAPALPDAAESGEERPPQLVVTGREVESSPVIVTTGTGRSYGVRMLTAKVPLIQLSLLLDRAVARGKTQVGIVLLSEPQEILTVPPNDGMHPIPVSQGQPPAESSLFRTT